MARTAAAWDPAQYLRFANERLRPALDLLAQVPLDAPAHVVDLGCGAGNVTAILKQRFPAGGRDWRRWLGGDAGEGARQQRRIAGSSRRISSPGSRRARRR